MDNFTKPSIIRLARRAGVKSMSEDCYEIVRNLIGLKLHEILRLAVIVNNERMTKTLMVDDVSEAFRLINKNIARSDDLSNSTCGK